jgi:hypothetical protein
MARSKPRTLRPNPHTLGVTLLKPGEDSRPIRVRAKLEVFEQLAGLTTTQIGDLLERALHDHADTAARNALRRHFTQDEALALHGRKVKFRYNIGPNERQGKQAFVYQILRATVGDGYELELNTGLIVTRFNFEDKLELLEV